MPKAYNLLKYIYFFLLIYRWYLNFCYLRNICATAVCVSVTGPLLEFILCVHTNGLLHCCRSETLSKHMIQNDKILLTIKMGNYVAIRFNLVNVTTIRTRNNLL